MKFLKKSFEADIFGKTYRIVPALNDCGGDAQLFFVYERVGSDLILWDEIVATYSSRNSLINKIKVKLTRLDKN